MPVSTPERPQPPSIEDPEEGNADLNTLGTEGEDGESQEEGKTNWLKLARDAYAGAVSYVDSNYRKQWEDSINAFNSTHPADSKYNADAYAKRSRLYRPKTRAVIRKNEAALAAAMFSNLDRTSVTAEDQSNPRARLSAAVTKELLQYRLTKSIPWFQIVCGGLQDAQVQGAVVAHAYWSHVITHSDTQTQVIEDKPCVDLLPIENFLFDPASDWTDPVNTSPYNIHQFPMYIVDVKDRMDRPDPKGRTWKKLDDNLLYQQAGDEDQTRQTRLQGQQDPTKQRRHVGDYDVVWIHRHIHRRGNQDWEFYTLASRYMLTDPEPLKDTVFHGLRPYIMGKCIIETHKPIPASLPTITRGLQDETNEVANQRMDNVKLVLNKRWKAKRGKNIDIPGLLRNVAGGVTLVDNMEDLEAVEFNDVTGSSFQEQDRINADFNELAGNFDASAVNLQNPKGGATQMMLAQAPTNLLVEYMLKTYVETFVQPLLRHLVLLEQKYETDQAILNLAGQKAQAAIKFGEGKITDDMLDHEMVVTVNVGMGATDPTTKLQRFIYAVTAFANVAKLMPPGVNLQEVGTECFALSGYQEGDRFFIGNDPQKVKMQQIVQALMMQLKQAKMQLKDRSDANKAKVHATDSNNLTKLLIEQMRHDHSGQELVAKHIMDLDKLQTTSAIEQSQPEPEAEAA